MDKLNEYAMKRDFIKSISDKIGVPAGYILIALVLTIVVLLYNGFGGLFVLLIFGFLYPAYITFKAIKYDNHELLIKFGKFWVVMGFGVALHEVIEWLAPELPLFGLFTIAGTFMLVKSQAYIAVYIYETLIAPFLAKFEPNIDSTLTSVEDIAIKEKEGFASVGAEVAKGVGAEVAKGVQEVLAKDKQA